MSADNLVPASGSTLLNDPAPPPSGRRWSPRGAREALQPVRAPEPPEPPRRRRSGGFLGKLSALFTLLVFVAIVGVFAVVYGQSQVNAPGPLTQDKIVFIPRGSGLMDISQILEQEGVINQPLLFQAQHYLSGSPNLKFGEYQFKQAVSLKDVRDILVEGKSILHSITIPEGLTSEQIVNRLRENDILVGEIRTVPREGALLPDTYRFGRGFSREQLLARMEAEQRKVLQEIWARRSPELPLRAPADLVILASIVEKETGRADERTRVASVFVNRLNRGMRLESDPTIIYGLVGGKGTLGRGILATEVRQPTPYNTYVINGLPPGPIANPGRASMEATANPSRTRDIFFVADGTGGHAFAETLEQHNRNVARWRQIERGETPGAAQAAPAPAAPAAPPPRPGQRSDLVPPGFQLGAPAPGGSTAVATPTASALPPSASAFNVPPVPLEVFGAVTGYGSGSAGANAPGGAFVDEPQQPSSGGVESYPVAPGRRQAIQRNSQQAGSAPGPLVQNSAADLAFTDAEPSPAPVRRGPQRGFDAVEGTARDPLRNKTFDLNSPKTIPQLR
jgi:UPF0755 protein